MRGKSSRKLDDLSVEYTSRPVSGWGGLVAIARFVDRVGLREFLVRALPDGRTSNNQVPVVDMVLQFLVTVLTGGSRFEHVERVRDDKVITRILKVGRFGSASSLTRYLGNFLQSQSEHLQVTVSALVFELIQHVSGSDVLDLDSTVFTRHGSQQGSAKGYNPHRRGARSHHPLLAMFAKTKIIAHAWLREGSASPHRGCQEFILELLSRLPATFRIEALRADSGFYSRDFMALLEERRIPYAIAAHMSPGFSTWCRSLTNWRRINSTTEIAEGMYKSPKARQVRRIIVIRDVVRRVTKDVLFEVVDYDYRAVVTSLKDDAVEVWRFYQKRGDCENRIKELKYDFNADGFCLQSFAGTEAAFRLICLLFNLVALFKATILHDRKTTLGTIRSKILVIGAALGSSARKSILRLGLQGRWRERFERLLNSIDEWSISTAAQLRNLLEDPDLEQPSCWRFRPPRLLPLVAY